ncbi:F-box protein [Prunus yedoensis var. nudiflora]|uniref:F-box protein n=1 Tax=Prunus yedoensis var. nudiflora TaxID=2094558 RepID=A0A314UQR2_PRUYE|nr:F-box protein [Prunus yedoensis var. nudiflora]
MKKTKLCCRNRAPNDEEGEEEHDQKPYILQLPDHLMVQIFCKITTKTLIQCKRVCKSWRCWLADPQFTRDLLSRTPASLLVSGFRTPTSKDTGYFFIDLDRASTLNRASSDVVLKLFSIKPNVQSSRGIHIVGSCNGFLCHELLSEVSNQLYISNPVTGESLTLPEPTNPCRTSPGKYGFGFSPISNVYKVVRIMSPIKGSEEQAMVLNVGSGIWRDIGGSVNSFGITDDGIYLNGFLHWIGRRRSEGSLLICAFDIESEHFRELPLPPCSLDLKKTRVQLGVLKGWLCLIISSRVKINVWVMKDYGVKESWTKEHEIRDPLSCFGTEILKFTGKGKVLVSHLSHLHAYTPATMGLVWVEVDELPAMVVEAWDLIPSFVSLKDITKGLELPAGVLQTM